MLAKEASFWRGPAAFILPAFVVYFIFLVIPLFGTIGFSFVRWDGIRYADIRFLGLQNYRSLFQDSVFWRALVNNLIFVGGAVAFQCTLGLAVALLLEQKRLPLGNFFRGCYFIPAVISLISIGIVFQLILDPSMGVLGMVFTRLGLKPLTGFGLWLISSKKAIFVLILIQIWFGFGWSMFVFVSGLKGIDPGLYEAAEVDGATAWHRVVYITLPLLKGTASVAVLLAATWAMKIFTVPYVMTRGGPNHATEVLATWSFYHGLSYQHVGYGSTIAVMLVFFGLILGFVVFRFTGMGKRGE